jgi:transposase InsO family protein
VSAYIDEHRARFGVEPICRTVGVSASAYYQRATGDRSARVVEDERLLEVIRVTHKRNYEAYGYRRTWKALLRAGERVARCRVQRLMREAGIQGAKRRGKPWRTTKPDPAAQRPRDLVGRDFTAPAPNRLWVGDFTYLRCWEGIVYFSFIIDVFSRMIVGWQLAANMRTTLVLDALRMALGLREPGADFRLVHHTDAGSQYTSIDYTQVLDDHLVLASIGTVGDALDNALAESFVDSYKTELIADRVWRSRAQLELATVEWVAWFNHDRLHEALGDIPPVEFEQLHAAANAPKAPISLDGSVAALPARAANGLTTRRISTTGVDFVAHGPISPENGSGGSNEIRSGRDNGGQGTNRRGWPLRPVVDETYSLTTTSKPTTPTTEKPT